MSHLRELEVEKAAEADHPVQVLLVYDIVTTFYARRLEESLELLLVAVAVAVGGLGFRQSFTVGYELPRQFRG